MEVELLDQRAHAILSLFSISRRLCRFTLPPNRAQEGPLFCLSSPAVGIIILTSLCQVNRQKMASQFNLHFFDYRAVEHLFVLAIFTLWLYVFTRTSIQ